MSVVLPLTGNGRLDDGKTFSTIRHQPSTIRHQSSAINHSSSAISHQPSAISHQPFPQ
jgi:hypothetical protein